MTLREEIRKLAEKVEDTRDWREDFLVENGRYSCVCVCCKHVFTGHKRRGVCRTCTTESSILAWIRLVLEREPSAEMLQAAHMRHFSYGEDPQGSMYRGVYRAMTAQLLKELEEK